MPALLEDYTSFENLAFEAGVSVRTVRRWTRTATPALAVTYLGRKPLVARPDWAAWLASRRVQRNVRRHKVGGSHG